MTEREGSAHGAAARELLIDRQLPRFQARTFSAQRGRREAPNRPTMLSAPWTRDQVGQTVPFMQLMVRVRDLPARLGTETRTATTDPASARQFRRYWTVIGPFAG